MSTSFPTAADQLLAQVALGNRAAFRTLYDISVMHLYPVALRILKQQDRAEEAVQDAFVQIWNKASQFESNRGSAGAWMSTIVRYRALDQLRRRPPEQSVEVSAELADAMDDIGRMLDGSDLQLCFQDLSPEQQRAVAMSYLEGLSHPELSERLATPLGTVKSWVRRGLLALRE